MVDKVSPYYKFLTETEKTLSTNFYRVELTGKRSRNIIHILVHKQVDKCLSIFLAKREEAGVDKKNNFVFSTKSGKNISAASALELFSRQCRAERPTALRSTLLRKSLATFTQLLSMSQTEMTNFATLMGHNYSIHHDFYKIPCELTQITQLNKVLLYANSNKAHEIKGKTLSDINFKTNDLFESPGSDDETTPKTSEGKLHNLVQHNKLVELHWCLD